MTTAPKSFFFISGDDDFLVHRQGEALFEAKAQGLDAYAKEIIEGSAQNVGEAERAITHFIQAVETRGLFSDQKVVWFKGVNFLGDNVTGRAEGTKAAVETLLQCLKRLNPTDVKVIITAFPVDRRRKEYKTLEALGDSRHLEGGKDEAQTTNLLTQEAQALGVTLSTEAALALANRVHGHTRMALGELKKLATFIGPGGNITPSLIDTLVPAFGDIDFFHAAEAFFTERLPAALAALKEHCFVHKEVRPLLSALQSRTRLLIQLKALMDAGKINARSRGIDKSALDTAAEHYAFPQGEKSTLNVFSQNPWYLGKLAGALSQLTLKQLVDYQLLFLRAFEELLDTPNEAAAVMERLYVRALT